MSEARGRSTDHADGLDGFGQRNVRGKPLRQTNTLNIPMSKSRGHQTRDRNLELMKHAGGCGRETEESSRQAAWRDKRAKGCQQLCSPRKRHASVNAQQASKCAIKQASKQVSERESERASGPTAQLASKATSSEDVCNLCSETHAESGRNQTTSHRARNEQQAP